MQVKHFMKTFQLTITCSKSTNVIDVVLVFLLLVFNIFSRVSALDFEQVNVSWVTFDIVIVIVLFIKDCQASLKLILQNISAKISIKSKQI